MATLIAPTFNLLVLVGILFYYLRQPLKDFVSSRHVTIRENLGVARTQMTKAKTEYAEFSAKLSSFQSEADRLRAEAAEEGQNLRRRIQEEATKLSKNILEDAKSSSAALYSELKGQLYLDLSTKVLERAENLLRDRLTGEDRTRIRREFSSQLAQAPAGSTS